VKIIRDKLENQSKIKLLKTVEWKNNKVIMIDQTKLPNELVTIEFDDFHQVADAILTLVVRGAPAIGVSGAFGLALAALQSKAITKDELLTDLEKARKILFETRPTAVNLAWGLEKIMNIAKSGNSVEQIKELVISNAGFITLIPSGAVFLSPIPVTSVPFLISIITSSALLFISKVDNGAAT